MLDQDLKNLTASDRGSHTDEVMAHCHVEAQLRKSDDSCALERPYTCEHAFGMKGILGEDNRSRDRLVCNQGGLFKAKVACPREIIQFLIKETKRDGRTPTGVGGYME